MKISCESAFLNHQAAIQTVPLTSKEKKKLKIEAEKEREKEEFEKNFKASSLYISKIPQQKSYVQKLNAIIVYHDKRLVKLDITN